MPEQRLNPNPVVRVLAAVIEEHGRYLVCRRPLHKRHGGLWEFPGGKLEVGETDFDAARRELREELAVEVIAVRNATFSMRDPGSPYLIAFVPTDVAGTPVCLEHIEHRWCTLSELTRLELAPSDKEFVNSALFQKSVRQPLPRSD